MTIQEAIVFSLEKTLDLPKKDFQEWLEKPTDETQGDFSLPCFRFSKQFKKSPIIIAENLASKFPVTKGVKEVKAVNGYLNFFFDFSLYTTDVLSQVLTEKEHYGKTSTGKGKELMIEFSGPNTNKPLHIGHLRNNSIGDSLANVYAFHGYNVIRANIISDRGIHISKSMYAYQHFGNNATPEETKQKSDHFVGDYYVLFQEKVKENPSLELELQELLVKWEQEDKETLALWKKMNDWALKGMNETYARTGIHFDEIYYESKHYLKGKELVQKAFEKKIFEKTDDGAILANLESFKLNKKILIRNDGTAIYMTQDIALAVERFSKHPALEKLLYVVASEQNMHFQQLFKILELMNYPWASKLEHYSYGMVTLPTGKMKSREGTVVDADDVIDELELIAFDEIKKRAPELKGEDVKKRAHVIALAAIKFLLLKIDFPKDILFHPKESLSFEGETGPYLLYSYARAQSILRKAGAYTIPKNFSLLKEDKEQHLIRLLAAFPQEMKELLLNPGLHRLCHYLLNLAKGFNSFYHEVTVLKAEKVLQEQRIALVLAVSIVLKQGLALLSISVLDKM